MDIYKVDTFLKIITIFLYNGHENYDYNFQSLLIKIFNYILSSMILIGHFVPGELHSGQQPSNGL